MPRLGKMENRLLLHLVAIFGCGCHSPHDASVNILQLKRVRQGGFFGRSVLLLPR